MRRVSARTGRGYVLILVLGLLALAALMAARFGQRIDELRREAASLQADAQQRLEAGNALAATLYWVTTRPVGPGGFGDALEPSLRADDRVYRLPTGGEVQVQDERGLYPLNAPDRDQLRALVRSQGIGAQEADAYIDILEDYEDTDNLKRLNGAEAPEYLALGLPPPRNDWLLSVLELNRMPRWKDSPQLVDTFERLASTSRQGVVNPNTAPLPLLLAMLPSARPEQLELFETLRRGTPFLSGEAARRATGLALDQDRFVYYMSNQVRITVSSTQAPRALQYNVLLSPAGLAAPWQIFTAHPVPKPERHDPQDREAPFPLAPASAPAS